MDSMSILWGDDIKPIQYLTNLPKIVQVEDGYYDKSDESTLSQGDILTVHLRKTLRTYIAVDKRGVEIRIPTSITAKVVISTQSNRTYETIKDLVQDGVEKVQWFHDTPWLGVQKGDITQIDVQENQNSSQSARMSFVNKRKNQIQVPMDYRSSFKPLSWTCWLRPGQEQNFTYPITVRFDSSVEISVQSSDEYQTMSDLGDITIKGFQESQVFIASIQDDENHINVLKIPISIDITVREGVGITNGESFDNVYQNVYNRAHIGQLEDIHFGEYIRIGDFEAMVIERIYNLPSESDDESYEYILPPRQPPREDSDSNSSDYEEYEINDNATTHREAEMEINLPRINIVPDPPENTKTVCCCFKRHNKYPISSTEQPSTTPTNFDQPIQVENEEVDTSEIKIQAKEIPGNLEALSTDEVLDCLQYLNLSTYIETFKESQIDGELLVSLDDDMLTELGVSAFGRIKLKKFIGGWRPENHSSES